MQEQKGVGGGKIGGPYLPRGDLHMKGVGMQVSDFGFASPGDLMT